MSWFEHDGSRIYYEDAGSGEPVLLLPGWAGSIEDLAPLREALTPRYRVIAADLPGSGQSGPQPRQYSPSYYEDDARSFLALLDACDAVPARLVGFSDGGEVALVMATLRPAAVRSLVAWGAAGSVEVPPEMVNAMYDIIDSPIEPLREFSQLLKDTYGEANARATAQNFVTAIRAMVAAGGDISRSRAGEITCPSLLIAGEHDFFAPPAIVSTLASAIPRGEFLEAQDAGHDVHHTHPEWFNTTVLEYLATHQAD